MLPFFVVGFGHDPRQAADCLPRAASFAEGRIGHPTSTALTTASTTTLTSLWREIVSVTRAGSYEKRTCSRCFKGRMYDMQRGAWMACERCSGTTRVVVYVYPKLGRRPR